MPDLNQPYREYINAVYVYKPMSLFINGFSMGILLRHNTLLECYVNAQGSRRSAHPLQTRLTTRAFAVVTLFLFVRLLKLNTLFRSLSINLFPATKHYWILTLRRSRKWCRRRCKDAAGVRPLKKNNKLFICWCGDFFLSASSHNQI